MGEHTKISWCDHTWNPWIGCTELSPACDNCYARTLAGRYGWAKWGAGESRHRTRPDNWKLPLKWDRAAAAAGRRESVFCASLSDWADAEVDESWRRDIEDVIDSTPHLDWLLLSKRHAIVDKWAAARPVKPHVRLGFTVENQQWADLRLPILCRLANRGWKTFVSYEPALGPVDWAPYMDGSEGGRIGWLIAGEESGTKRRRPERDWLRQARDACQRHGVPFLFKQEINGEGKKVELPLLDGRRWAEIPEAA